MRRTEITKEIWKPNSVKVIVLEGKKCRNEKHIETRLGHANLQAATL